MKKHPKIFALVTIICLILGALCGIYLKDLSMELAFIGKIYVNLLKLLILPIIFFNMVVAVYNGKKKSGRTLLKSVLLFAGVFILTFSLTALIASLLNSNILSGIKVIPWDGAIDKLKFGDVLVNIFPSNFTQVLENNILTTIILAISFGVAATKIKNSEKIIDDFSIINNIFNILLEYVMFLTPIATFSLVSSAIAGLGINLLIMGLKYVIVAWICAIIMLLLIMVLPICIAKKMWPHTVLRKLSKVIFIALTTCSSVATLPYTISTAKKEFNVDKGTTDLVVPLGATINMLGGAVSFALLAIFNARLFNIPITTMLFITMALYALLINMGAPGIPNGGIVIGATYLSMLGIPLDFIGLYSGLYKLLDMAYTTLNVVDDITASVIIEKLNNKKEKSMI